jgi:hypothetical protein
MPYAEMSSTLPRTFVSLQFGLKVEPMLRGEHF